VFIPEKEPSLETDVTFLKVPITAAKQTVFQPTLTDPAPGTTTHFFTNNPALDEPPEANSLIQHGTLGYDFFQRAPGMTADETHPMAQETTPSGNETTSQENSPTNLLWNPPPRSLGTPRSLFHRCAVPTT
jgi:hypothetical protein